MINERPGGQMCLGCFPTAASLPTDNQDGAEGEILHENRFVLEREPHLRLENTLATGEPLDVRLESFEGTASLLMAAPAAFEEGQ